MSQDPPGSALAAAGLSAAQEAAYALLVEASPCSASELAGAWTHPEPLAGVLESLVAEGLATALPRHADGQRYAAVDPEVALEALLASHAQQLKQAAAYAERLASSYQSPQSGDIADVLTSRQAIGQRLSQLLRSTRREIRCLAGPPHLDQAGIAQASAELLGRDVTCRVIYERAGLDEAGGLPGIERLTQAGQQSRVLPFLPARLLIADDRFALMPLDDTDSYAVIIHRCALLDALSALFEGLWQRALPLLPAARSGRDGAAPASQPLIALLLSGLTDESIARHLGIGHRTAQRRIAALMADFGARTRFQAGVQAAFRAKAARED